MQTLLEQEPETRIIRYDNQHEAEPLLTLFENIAQEQNWKPSNQLRAYPTSSISFGLEVDGNLAGGLQLVRNTEVEGMPCTSVWPELNLQGCNNMADIALLAIKPNLRGQSGLFWLLCVEMWRYCRVNHVDSLWVEVTPTKLRLYRRLGWPLQIAGPLRKHWDEPCYPCSMTLDAAEQEVTSKAVKSTFYQQILQLSHR
jgi:hypothetical protein